jgi:hypothetical protein
VALGLVVLGEDHTRSLIEISGLDVDIGVQVAGKDVLKYDRFSMMHHYPLLNVSGIVYPAYKAKDDHTCSLF